MLINPFSTTVAQAMMNDHLDLLIAAELNFDSGVTRVHSGTGNFTIAGHNFIGVGTLGSVSEVKEQNSTSPTQLNLTLGGLDTALIATVLNENCVGKLGSLYIGVLDEDGVLIDYDVLFRGKIRSTTVVAGNKSAINLTLSNIFEDWSRGKSWRYTDESQRQRNGGDRIFRYVPQMADRSLYWGSKKDAPPFRYTR